MKKWFQAIGLMSLICLSFYVTEKTMSVVKEYDEIMIEIKEQKKNYETNAENAIIKNGTIRPGKKGKTIDENKSYSKMKQYGSFNPNLLEYTEVLPEVSLAKNYQYYVVGGNPDRKQVTLLFLMRGEEQVDPILSILEQKQIKANFFVDHEWLEENNERMLALIKQGHVVGNLSRNEDYSSGDFAWMNTIISKIGKQKQGYCYSEEENKTALTLCSAAKNYTIQPSVVIKNHLTTTAKETMEAGSILAIEPTTDNLQELPVMIEAIKRKGYEIVSLTELLAE